MSYIKYALEPENIYWFFHIFLGLLVMFIVFPALIIGLSYPSVFISKKVTPKKWSSLIIVTLISIINFAVIAFVYEFLLLSSVETVSGRGIMNMVLIFNGFPVMLFVLVRNIRKVFS